MQDKHLYEYAVIRFVPQVDREEFLNVGIIFFCKKEKFLKVLYKLDHSRLKCFDATIDLEQVEQNLGSFHKISEGTKEGGLIAELDPPSRFRWLTAIRSSVIQTSRPHPGICNNLDETLELLFNEMVI